QQKASHDQELVAVKIHDLKDKFLGFALFHYNHYSIQYAVGVYDRDVGNFPIGHLVQNTLIKYAQEKKLKTYFIGTRLYEGNKVPLYPGYTEAPSEKLLQISYFKEGFVPDMKTRLIFNISRKDVSN
ncbi:MAG: hypothetical protein AAF244_03090, partial [Pseudomonadota bacterium]